MMVPRFMSRSLLAPYFNPLPTHCLLLIDRILLHRLDGDAELMQRAILVSALVGAGFDTVGPLWRAGDPGVDGFAVWTAGTILG